MSAKLFVTTACFRASPTASRAVGESPHSADVGFCCCSGSWHRAFSPSIVRRTRNSTGTLPPLPRQPQESGTVLLLTYDSSGGHSPG